MFYSHEVLTSRKYGIATVWLVATLGQKSALKKVSRKAILDVDVAKACETIVAPEAPLALRLQSNLLYGLTRVYSQQCAYVLTDAEAARNTVRQVVRLMKQANLEEDGNKAKREQLILQDDPNFLPALDLMPVDLDNLDFDINHDTQTTLSPESPQYTSSQHSIGGLMIPPSRSSFIGGPVGGLDLLSVRGDYGSGTQGRTGMVLEDDDLGFVIETDGTFREEEPQPSKADRPVPVGIGGLRLYSQLHSPPRPPTNLDDGFTQIQDDFISGEQYSMRDDPPTSPSGLVTATAVRRTQPKQHKPVPRDTTTTLRNHDLNRWSAEYLQNMHEATKQRRPAKLAAIAKKNAAHWVLSADSALGEGILGPLDMFSGRQLLSTFNQYFRKREREDDESPETSRRVRQRTDTSSADAGRDMKDDEGFMPVMDDYSIEQGREAPTSIDDRHLSSIFPWNQSAGSRGLTDIGHPTSASCGGGAQLNLLGRSRSRLTSASPLVGRGRTSDVDDHLQLPGSDFAMGGMKDDEQFELFGAAAQVDTQTAAQSQWQRTILSSESGNFLLFLQNVIEEENQLRGDEPVAVDEDEQPLTGSIDFDTLLPIDINSYIVAAQAFLHVLALGNKNLLSVAQDEPFGSITLRANLV
ncbi:hypothetical protein DOTSEDRAFT_19460 [Dothistroma septosporum NZE10]|uniref:Rad21/Rec8-like protein N-terminal domain-containing protein n=1 Tax=Dothistroma septosporum (strain NZE10 / CBS 128990) TaxID=675120 RepID=N1Q122_DOTSN|nr:hypothetical protein DOTSEDRAFT_19460 [Dothistroma septosporum NZE10]